MSFEVLEKLESKVQSAVDTISILQMEIEELKLSNSTLSEENEQLKGQQQLWQERLQALLGKMDQMEESV